MAARVCEKCGGFLCHEPPRYDAVMVWVSPGDGHMSRKPMRLSDPCYRKTVDENKRFGYDADGNVADPASSVPSR